MQIQLVIICCGWWLQTKPQSKLLHYSPCVFTLTTCRKIYREIISTDLYAYKYCTRSCFGSSSASILVTVSCFLKSCSICDSFYSQFFFYLSVTNHDCVSFPGNNEDAPASARLPAAAGSSTHGNPPTDHTLGRNTSLLNAMSFCLTLSTLWLQGLIAELIESAIP